MDETDLIYLSIIGGFTALTLIYFVVISRYSGSAQWAFVLIIVAVSVLVALRLFKRRLKKQYPLQDTKAGRKDGKSELAELRSALERGDAGLTYSQLIVKERFIRILMNRIRIENGLSLEAMKNLRHDNEKLMMYIQDQKLLDLTIYYIKELDNWNESMKKKGEGEFSKNVDILMKKMEV